MKTTQMTTMGIVGVLVICLIAPVSAQHGKSIFELASAEAKQSGKDFKPAPETIKTRFGNLEFPGGYPTEETSKKVYDELDLQRATQLYLDMYPALSMRGMMIGTARDYGSRSSSHIAVTADRLDSSALFLTGNTESIYAMLLFDLKVDGPTVFQAPEGLMGPFNDANFLFVFDIGPTGQDKGKGGKYLILPPDYKGEIPDGYFVVRSPTYRNYSFVRANAEVVGSGEKAMEFFRKNCSVYPLTTGPRKNTFTNVSGTPINTLVPEDATAFAWMHDIINYEPAEAFGKELLGRLASIGIVKGKPFSPDARMQKIMEQAAREGVAMSRVIALESRQPEAQVYPDRAWETPFIGNCSSFDPDGYFNLEARTTFHFTADGITPSMAAQMPDGLGSRYQTTYKDKDGNYLDGNKAYKLNIPTKVPVALFWSIVVYDSWTRCELQSQRYPSLSSQRKPAPESNADGSIDVYFSIEKPKGVAEQNWVKTLPDQGFFVYMRYYGPLKEFNEKTWIPNDVELVK
ncbi:DUF1254 domain-containing protein [Candidatus Sumerlaeota bacterium]